MTWTPTEHFLHGRLKKAFLPFDKHPTLKNDNFKNLYPGDEVYVFETKDQKWARGYSLTRPFPSDFTVTSVNLDDLPGLNVKVVVFPLNYVEVIETLPLSSTKSSNATKPANGESAHAVPTLKESELSRDLSTNADGKLTQEARAVMPYLPYDTFTFADDFGSEITYTMNLLTSHMFALYSIGEFKLFKKLYEIYYSLDENRVRISHPDLTFHESITTRQTITCLLNEIPKLLASRSARLNENSYDLDTKSSDVSAYKAVMARHTSDGRLLSLENSSPAELAYNQQLSALYPKFPINTHLTPEKFALTPLPNKKLLDEAPSNILVDFKSVSGSSTYQPEGFAGMIAYLYIRNNKRRLTEAFAVHTNSVDELLFVEKISAALFRNIPVSEIENQRVYLVAVLTEEVDIPSADASAPQVGRVKKGVAAGVADITRVFSRNQGSLSSGKAHQFAIRLFGSHVKKSDNIASNRGWGEVVDRIIKGSSEGVVVNPRAEKLVVSVRQFEHQITGTDLSQGEVSPQIAEGKAAPIATIKPIFFDFLAENYERVYLKLGKISMADDVSRKSLLTVSVNAPNNKHINFAKASNQISKSSWQFVSVNPNEVVGEIVKVNGISHPETAKSVPKKDYITLYLYVDGVLAGTCDIMYKNDAQIVQFNQQDYHIFQFVSKKDSVVAHIEVHTEYIGKIFNKPSAVEALLSSRKNWKGGHSEIKSLNQSLLDSWNLKFNQLLGPFPEVLESVLNIIDLALRGDNSAYSETADTAFKTIVFLLDTMFGKQDQYLYMFDSFISEHQVPPKVGIFLLKKISEMFVRADAEWSSMSRSICRVLSLLVKVSLQPAKTMTESELFTEYLGALFKSVSYFISLEEPALINDQVLSMELCDFVLAQEDSFNHLQLLDIVLSFIDSVGSRGAGIDEEYTNLAKAALVAKEHKLVVMKLLLISRLFASKAVHNPRALKPIVSKCVKWSVEIFDGPLDVPATRLACSVMNNVCDLVEEQSGTEDAKLIAFSLTKHLGVLAKTFVKYHKFTRGHEFFKPKKSFTHLFPREFPFKEIMSDLVIQEETSVEVLIELAVIFSYVARIGKKAAGEEGFLIINSTQNKHEFYDQVKYQGSRGLRDDLFSILSGIQILRQGKYFPLYRWVSMYSALAEGCLSAVELIKPVLLDSFIPDIDNPEKFDRSLWGNFLTTILRLAVLPPVSIEHLSTIPRKACQQITGSMRGRIANTLEESWNALAWDATSEDALRFSIPRFGGYQVEFISSDYSIIQDLMLFALQKNEACQAVSVNVLWTILASEYILNNSIIEVERECLTGLNEVYSRAAYKPAANEQLVFIERLKEGIRLDREDEAYPTITRFLTNLSGFLEVLNNYSAVPFGVEFDDDRTFHKLNIRSYLKNADKPELFNSFIHQMFEENLRKRDFIQAALSLELLATTYEWDQQTILPASYRPKYPQQSSFERKEALFKLIAQNFIKGNSLEKATDIYNELLEAYNDHTYDLKAVAHAHQKLAKLYLEMESSDKLSPSYFRVAYIGAGFPANIRGKEQIFEGLPFEHITSIHERLLKMYPGARIVTDDTEAEELNKRMQTGRYLHVNAVEPVTEVSDKIMNTSIGERQYARNKNLRFFSVTKKLGGSTSVFDLWTEEVTYKTRLSFPTLMNRSEIVGTTVVKLSPLENAVRTILKKNNELSQSETLVNLAYQQHADYSSLLNDLSRHLAGTVDAPVNGGVNQYRSFFVDAEEGSEEYYNLRLLKNAFDDLATVLSRCLHLHGKLIGSSMKPAHDSLVKLFHQNFETEIARLKINTNYESLAYNHSTVASGRAPMEKKTNGSASEVGSLSTGSSLSRTRSRNSLHSDITATSERSSTGTLSGVTGVRGQRRTASSWRRVVA